LLCRSIDISFSSMIILALAQKQSGYDAIKVVSNLLPDVYEAILEAAEEHNLPVYGQVPKRVGLEKAMNSGQLSFEHLNHFLDALYPSDSSDERADLGKIPSLAAMTVAKGVWICPTLEMFRIYAANPEEIKAIRNHPSTEVCSRTTQECLERIGALSLIRPMGQ